jgi:hypothetical protein
MEQSTHSSMSRQSGGSYAAPSKDIVDTAIAAGNFTTFISAVKTAGLTDTLTGKGPFTVFAPADEAFEKLPAGALDALIRDTAKLKAVLSYHVVKGHILLKDVKSGEVTTLQRSFGAVIRRGSERHSGQTGGYYRDQRRHPHDRCTDHAEELAIGGRGLTIDGRRVPTHRRGPVRRAFLFALVCQRTDARRPMP